MHDTIYVIIVVQSKKTW